MVNQNIEKLGPAERIINTLLNYSDHAVHNRPGFVVADPTSVVGVRWEPVTHVVENDQKIVYRFGKVGKKSEKIRVGVLQDNNDITENGRKVGMYRPAGLYPEVCAYLYRQIAEVWKLDNEFAARWASYAFKQEHRDLKVILAAFMLCQSRKGDPVIGENGKPEFYDEDYRDIGEAMLLTQAEKGFDAKLLLRVYNILTLPEIAAINRELGFGKSLRNPHFGRYEKTITKWLSFRESNPKVLEGLVKKGFSTTVMDLCRRVHFKPENGKFFEVLRWKQHQSKNGHRELNIGTAVKAAETWEGLSESQICEKIVKDKINYKRVTGLLPKNVGITRAIVAACIESGGMSNKDLIMFTPTLEELGLLNVQDIRDRWNKAVKESEDMRAANIARNVKTKEIKDKLDEAGDNALKKAIEEVTKNIRVYLIVDRSGSMEGAIEAAKAHLARFAQGFPLDRLHVSTFNTVGQEIRIQHATKAGVENAFRGVAAGGGTDYGAGIRALMHHRPTQDEDVVFLFVGDEGHQRPHFADSVQVCGLNPMAFGLVPVTGPRYGRGTAVRETATRLGIPCFEITDKTFEDPYAIPRTLRALIASTPVGTRAVQVAAPRLSLVETILKTELLKPPAWATA